MLKWKCSLGTALRAQGRHCHCWLQHRQRTFSTSELSFLLLTPKRCFGLSRYGRKTNPAPVQHMLPSGPIAKKIQARNEHKRAISARDIKQYQRCHVAVTHTNTSLSHWSHCGCCHGWSIYKEVYGKAELDLLLLQSWEGFGVFMITNGCSSPPLPCLNFISPPLCKHQHFSQSQWHLPGWKPPPFKAQLQLLCLAALHLTLVSFSYIKSLDKVRNYVEIAGDG